MRVYFPRYQIESHREPWQSAALVVELAKLGVECVLEMDDRCDAVFVGSFLAAADAANGYTKHPHNIPFPGYKHFPDVPVIHYCWDLYPWQVEGKHDDNPDYAWRWLHYVKLLRQAAEVWVPSGAVLPRLQQYADRDGVVIPACTPLWEPPEPPRNGSYVVDVMRKYPQDPNRDAVREACAELNIPCVETGASLSWNEYRRTIANARLLVSAYAEASTGSLALLEGYRLGKPVLLCDSPLNGGVDYFGDRAAYFRWNDRADLKAKLQLLYDRPGCNSAPFADAWVRGQYGEAAFARRAAARLKEIMCR